MQDDYIRSRGFALTLARRAVNDLRRDEFRQLRNYVDLCQALAQKTRYSGFFAKAQQVLQRADSLYAVCWNRSTMNSCARSASISGWAASCTALPI